MPHRHQRAAQVLREHAVDAPGGGGHEQLAAVRDGGQGRDGSFDLGFGEEGPPQVVSSQLAHAAVAAPAEDEAVHPRHHRPQAAAAHGDGSPVHFLRLELEDHQVPNGGPRDELVAGARQARAQVVPREARRRHGHGLWSERPLLPAGVERQLVRVHRPVRANAHVVLRAAPSGGDLAPHEEGDRLGELFPEQNFAGSQVPNVEQAVLPTGGHELFVRGKAQ